MATGLACLLFISLVLAACGGAAAPVPEESVTSGDTEEVAQPAAESEKQAQESQEAASAEEEMTAAEETEATSEEAAPEESEAVSEEPAAEESATKEAEATDNESSSAPEQELASSSSAACRAVTPDNDPIAAVLQPNELIAPISDSDWTKGPADAPITFIEYGDFQ